MRGPVVVAALGLLVACGGGDDGSDVASSSTLPSTSTISTSTTAPRPSTSTTSTTVPVTAAGAIASETIDIGGSEALGLAVDEDAVYAVSFQAGTINRIDPSTGEVTSQALPGGASTALAAEGALWVASYPGRSTLTKLEPSDLSTIDSSSPGELCCDLTFGDGALWAADPGGRVLRIQPATLVVADEYPVTLDRNAHTNLVYADGYVWVSSDSTDLMRLDPATGETTPFDVGGGVPFFARDGLVWGASTDEVWAVDSRTGEERQRVRLQDSIEVMALELDDSNMLWVGLRHPGRRGAVVRVDASTGAEFGEVPVDIPARIVLGFGSAWVTDSGSSLVYRLTS